MQPSNRYLNAEAERKLARRAKLQTGWGWGLSIFFALAVILSLTAEEGEQIGKDLFFYVGCLVPAAALLLLGFRSKGRLAAARRYAACFSADRDGFVDLRELARATGLPEQTALQRLDRLFNAGLFASCTLQRGGDRPGVALQDPKFSPDAIGYVNVKCASCGGTTRIRAGAVGKCDYCGSPVRLDS